jgi:uncharacterized protein DUF6515
MNDQMSSRRRPRWIVALVALLLGVLLALPVDLMARGGRGGGGRGGGGRSRARSSKSRARSSPRRSRGSVRYSSQSRRHRNARRSSAMRPARGQASRPAAKRPAAKRSTSNHRGYHRKSRVKQGHSINRLPNGARSVRAGTHSYSYYRGRYYSQRGNSWVVVRPAYHCRIRTLPVGYRRIYWDNRPYYYYGGVYYSDYDDDDDDYAYETVAPEVGMVVKVLPDDAEEVMMDDKRYYKVDDVIYEPVYVAGQLKYRVFSVG